ncbi:MAG: DUF4870 family protein [Novosphingobium sp.]
MEDKVPGLNEIMPPGGNKPGKAPAPMPSTPRPAPRTAPAAEPAPQAAASPAAPPQPGAQTQPPPATSASSAAAGSFDLNQPTIVDILYLSAPFFGITGVVGLVLAYVWRSEKPHGWEATHYTYLIRGFWIWFAGFVIGFLTLVVFIGIFILIAAYALIVVRAVLSIIRAQKQEPMPEPETWLA